LKFRLISIGGRYNYVKYNGYYYSTISDVSIDGTSSTCQKDYLSVPSGWIVAPDDENSQHVIENYSWSTDYVLTSGDAYCTSNCDSKSIGSKYLNFDEGGRFYSSICNSQILIV
jgi:hypothetical protein